MARTTAARKAAKGEPCLIRVPGACNGDPTRVVGAHYSLGNISGRGLKSPDHMMAYGCDGCHDEIDGRTHVTSFTKTQLRLMHAEGVFRTQEYIRLKRERPWEIPCL